MVSIQGTNDNSRITTKNNAVEVLRILLTMAIIIFHAVTTYDKRDEIFHYWRHSRYAVECFFIMSGFYLCKDFGKDFKQWIKQRFLRLFPVVFFVLIIVAIVTHPPLYKVIPDLYIVTDIGIGGTKTLCGYNWFVNVLFWVSCFYFLLFKSLNNENKFVLVTGLLIYFPSVLYFSSNYRFIAPPDNIMVIFNSGILRGIISVGIGCLIYKLLYNPVKKSNVESRKKFVLTLLEIFFFCYLFAQMYVVTSKNIINNALFYILIFGTVFTFFVNQLGYFSQLLCSFNISRISKYCYSCYIAQTLANLYIKNVNYDVNNIVQNVTTFIILTLFWGIILHLLIEKPISGLLKCSNKNGSS